MSPSSVSSRCSGGRHPVLDDHQPVVHVTQGTLDNADPSQLLLPTIDALRGARLTVVASTGGGTHPGIAALAGDGTHVHVVDFVCYSWLLPRIDLMITNGGYGGVQVAARHGVPLIVAGDTQDKAEVAARVRWSGVGVDLRSGRPRPRRIGNAVARILTDHRYTQRAADVAASAERLGDPTDRILRAVAGAL